MITEGRKENLLVKYPDDRFVVEFLESDFQVKSNYKYADWVLKQYFKSDSDIGSLGDVNYTLIKFEKFRKNLEKKDINQYQNFGELESVIEKYGSNRKNTIGDTESVKIIDNEDIIIVRPLTHQSSCKYGAGTKWCTTHKNDSYFKDYTSKGNLYYIHLKDFESDNPFYKMAVHIKYNGDEEWYDAEDKKMSDSQAKMAKMLIHKVDGWVKIIEDLKSSIPNKELSSSSVVETMIQNILDIMDSEYFSSFDFGIDKPIFKDEPYRMSWEIANSEAHEVMGATIEIPFMLNSDINEHGFISGMLRFVVTNHRVVCRFHMENRTGVFEDEEDRNVRAFGINHGNIELNNLIDLVKKFADGMVMTPKILGKITNSKFWRPLNRQSTYTFSGNGRLTNAFKEHMNELGPEGLTSKVDFLTDIGRIEKREDGYVKKGTDDYINIGGYFSTFFASLKNAGAIEYVRQGRRFMMKQGPNYKDFVNGTLNRI